MTAYHSLFNSCNRQPNDESSEVSKSWSSYDHQRGAKRRKTCEQSVTKSGVKRVMAVSDMFVDKYKPSNVRQVIGQQADNSCVHKLTKWLANWHNSVDQKRAFGKCWSRASGDRFKAALLSGAPGIGKTTIAQLVCKELAFDYFELNASHSRNKKCLEDGLKQLVLNMRLTHCFANSSMADNKNLNLLSAKHVLIMDEVDGMSANEDRGGVQQLIQLIKITKVPIICICNDRSHPKMRSLANYCFDLKFVKPRIEQIKGAMMSVAYKEGIQISANSLHELIVSSNQDIRQVLHHLSLLGASGKRVDSMLNEKAIKDARKGTFDALYKVFTSGEEYARMSFQDKSDLFFCDYSIMPLFVFENYISVTPKAYQNSERVKLKLASEAIDAIQFGDLIGTEIRTNNNWSLLPLQAAFSTVMPGFYMNGYLNQQIAFPSFMAKMLTTVKKDRLLQELKMHMNLKVSGSKTALNLDYLEIVGEAIMLPLINNTSGGIPAVIELLNNYCLRREDIESILELTLWENQTNPMSKVDPKTKSALTRAYNKQGFTLPYSLGTVKRARIGANNEESLDDQYGNDAEVVDEDEAQIDDKDNIDLDAMIKTRKKSAKTKTIKKDDEDGRTLKKKSSKKQTKKDNES